MSKLAVAVAITFLLSCLSFALAYYTHWDFWL
jgi:hypothetical protein